MGIAYLTDVEGQWEKVDTFCAGNRLVTLEGDDLVLAEGATFVFGGDAVDRGPHGRRAISCLSRAKRRYGDRVVLLAGNRDINKIRLARELAGHPPARAPHGLEGGALLRWIFAHTMGAKDAFEHRRAELGAVDDDAVVQSFLDDVAVDGPLTHYLASCQLAYRSWATLFVHGGLGEESLGAVPGASTKSAKIADVDTWAALLNAWYDEQIAAFVAGAREPDGTPSWEPLIAYQAPLPGRSINPGSVVYGRLADANNDPRLPPAGVVERLRDAGVRRLVVGHTPSGDTPSILRDPARGFELIAADNSYGRVTTGSRILLDDSAAHVSGRAVLDDGRRVEVAFSLALDDDVSPIGLRARDGGYLIKAPLLDGGVLGFRYLPGFTLEQRALEAPGDAEPPY
jgi:hypothetical protein